MMSKGNLIRFELLSWREYLEKLINNANFFLAIYLILEIAGARYYKLWGIVSNT